MTERPALQIRGLSKSFPSNGNGTTHALRGIDLDLRPGEFIVVVGPNGSGKTTLLNLLAGDFDADAGQIVLNNGKNGTAWLKMPRWQRATYLARVHQDPRRGTAAGMTVWENLRLACSRQRVPLPWSFAPPTHDRQWFIDRLERLGLDSKIDSRVAELSQGQRQLLALELAILREPVLLLADEHTASLDQANAKKCLEATVALSQESGVTVIMVTHNLMDALNYGDRLIVMRDGAIERDVSRNHDASLQLNELIALCGYVA
ncbi:MAG: ATP-binding cassette domain-containing protein [Phycisphaerales bacterium]|nr:ATP-binding cassette domain-containing protein [Phycisphaerales bacterium]MCB9856968.1 ATP-binding cassette domain-containing protein [Phycisphaerales bacterium]MCB9861905.1 ATP-binding cassette domain-containing protein [Phycisphaerales bacterium]